jgi:hypothetical protein
LGPIRNGYFGGAGVWGDAGWLSDTRLVSLWNESPTPLDMSPNEPAAAGWQAAPDTHGFGAICVTAICASGAATQPAKPSAKAQAATGTAGEKC